MQNLRDMTEQLSMVGDKIDTLPLQTHDIAILCFAIAILAIFHIATKKDKL
jgi:hypothetical protein